jgi:hypothetical protein
MAQLIARTPRIVNPQQAPLYNAKRSTSPRYYVDRHALYDWFGGPQRAKELCEVFGVPPLSTMKGAPLATLPNLLVLLELSHRMGKPLDLYTVVREQR